MARLIAKSWAEGVLPATRGGWSVCAVMPATITAVMPFAGADLAALPPPNRFSRDGAAMTIWAGLDLFLALDTVPDIADAAIVDQTDAWAVLDLTGPGGDAVLARLCPVDTRPARFPAGHGACSLLGHVRAIICRLSNERLRILVPRSMAQTAVHDLTRAMDHAARQISSTATLGELNDR